MESTGEILEHFSVTLVRGLLACAACYLPVTCTLQSSYRYARTSGYLLNTRAESRASG